MRRWLSLLAAALIAGCATALPARSAEAAGDTPPLVAGRVSLVEGDVNIWRAEEAGDGQWDRAQINDVVTSGTGLATSGGRTEVRFGPHALRLDNSTSGGFSQLDFDRAAFALERGVVNLNLASVQQSETVSLEVGGVRVDFSLPGQYRIDAIDGEPLKISVFHGQAAVHYGSNGVTVASGQALAMTQSSINFASVVTTPFDEWAFARDQRYAQVQSARYVSPSMTGYEELDTYGDWISDASYGQVWAPRAVPVGWAPYRYGRWRWVSPWGWTWVDAAPWGYAPFHYGRWVFVGSRWCWWPGSYVARPVWAPALVGFVGTTGAAVPFGAGGPVVGWYPLAPWHPYRPNYRVDARYVTVINQTIINVPPRGVPRDANQQPGSTWVPGQQFREPVAKVRIPAQTAKVADVQPIAPPPRPVRTVARSDDAPRLPPPRVAPPMRSAQNDQNGSPKFKLSQPQPLPGADTTLNQPAPIPRAETARPQPAPAHNDAGIPRQKPIRPDDVQPPYQQLQEQYRAKASRPQPPPPAAAPVAPPAATRTAPPAATPPASMPGAAPAAPVARAAPPPERHAPPAGPPQRVAPPAAVPVQRAEPPGQAARGPQQAAPTSKQQAVGDAQEGGSERGRGKPQPDVPRSKMATQ